MVAIRVLTQPVGTFNTELTDPSQGPSPVVTTGSKNGIVGGLPTHYVIYNPASPVFYSVYRFFLKTELNDPTDPAPINLVMPGQYVGDVLPGSTDPTQNSAPSGGSQFGFTIDTSFLDQHANTPQSVTVIQFNILTMNVAATTMANVNQRVMDAIGYTASPSGSTFNNPIQVNITTSNTYTDQSSSVPEQVGDTFPSGSNLPSVDLASWSLTVATPA